MTISSGFHHVTLMSGDPKANVHFYAKVLGLRLIKRTVNFDDPTTWHLYFGDERGNPGTVLTTFPFKNGVKGQIGTGQVREIRFAIPSGKLNFWQMRLEDLGVKASKFTSFSGEKLIKFIDPDGLPLGLVESQTGFDGFEHEGLTQGEAIRGFAGMTLLAARAQPSMRVLEALGFQALTPSRFITQDNQTIDIETSHIGQLGRGGIGTVHHVAFRAKNSEAQEKIAKNLKLLGLKVTEQVDRQYFKSIYFREPSGILYEIATDKPGFLVDEPLEKLGQKLQLPEWFEPHRAAITSALTPLE